MQQGFPIFVIRLDAIKRRRKEMSKTIVVDDLFQKDFQEYKKEYAIWVETMNTEFHESIEMPCDDILLALAVAKGVEFMKDLNEFNKNNA